MVKRGWVCCPKCGRKLFPVDGETRISRLKYMCRHCKELFEVNI